MAKKNATQNKKQNTGDGAAKVRKQSQNTLIQLALSGTAIGLVISLICFAIVGLWQFPNTNNQQVQTASERIGSQLATTLNKDLQRLTQRLQAMGQPELLDALENRDDAQISYWQQRLSQHFPEATSTKLLPLGSLGIAGLRREQAGLRNNIEMDLLRRASSGNAAGPEAYQVDGRWLVSIAQPIASRQGDYSAGAVLLSLPAQYFTSGIDDNGQIELIQKIAQQERTFTQSGSAGDTTFSTSHALKAEGWQLRFTPSPQLQATLQIDSTLLWVLAAVSAAAILAGGLVSAQLLRRSLEQNMRSLLSGDESALTLPGFATLRMQLNKKLAAAKAARTKAAAAEKEKAEPVPEPVPSTPEPAPELEELPALELPPSIFRAYDIRGRADTELTDAVVYHLGLAIGSEALDRGQQIIAVARDGRESSPAIADALIRGLRDSGRDVIDLGLAPTPLLYFATHQLETQSGVMITGSHNPPAYNGLKIVLAGRPVAGPAVQALRHRIETRQFSQGQGGYSSRDLGDDYIDAIAGDVAIAQPLKVVLDAGNGVAGSIAPALFQALGCEVVPLYCDVDGRFPNHHPDPTVAANLDDLVAAVREQGADLGLAFDGDGDRLGAVTGSGEIVPADRLLMLLAQDVVARNPGADVLFDVKCSRHLNTVISQFGGRPIMWKSGHSFMKEKMAETGALLGGEFSGHIFFKERWFGFDDALYAGARLIEILSTGDPSLDNQLAALPQSASTPELRLAVDQEGQQFELVEQLVSQGQFGDGKITTLDGIRVDYPDGWGLVRASNTEPALILRFEADDNNSLERIQQLFRDQLGTVDPKLAVGF